MLALLVAGSDARAQTAANILNTPHNLSVTGTGSIRALTETRICIFCHTPHNATPASPLWNKDLEPQVYTVYTSPTLATDPLPQPFGPTKLCLSCHDGTIAMGNVVQPSSGIAMAGGGILPSDSLANFGLNLSGHHPVAFSYNAALPNPELVETPPPDLVFGGTDEVHCTTCHDPHNDDNGMFLLKDNRYSALCTTCHQITNWESSGHATSTALVGDALPRPPKTWPDYTQLNEWGCEACHTPHFAPTGPYLLNFTDDPDASFSCVNEWCHGSPQPPAHSPVAAAAFPAPGGVRRLASGSNVNIEAQIRKPSAHREMPGRMALPRGPRGPRRAVEGVTCVDCHNPHVGRATPSRAPFASGVLAGVSGVDRNGVDVSTVRYEYEVCFKCHSDDSSDVAFVPRVLADINKRRTFDPSNPSYHPVLAMGKDPNVPSIPSDLEPDLSSTDIIYCTSCHADDEGGTNGPHGSSYPPILRERYETADNVPESYENYALCYRCHNRSNILSDVSFRTKTARTTASGGGHSGHLAASAPCSACHDAHGISEWGTGNPGSTGSHTHLINFDMRIVSPRLGASVPIFTDTGTFSGSCDLVCHGVDHDNASYP